MGGKPSHFSDTSLQTFQKSYEFVKEIKDERWGVTQVWREKSTKRHVMIISKPSHSDQEFKEYMSQLQERSIHQNPHILNPIGWKLDNADGLCGHTRKCDIYFDYLGQNLKKEIHRRAEKKEYFDEVELWYLARALISVGADLEIRGVYHGDLRPHQVLLTERVDEQTFDGEAKVVDNGLVGLYRNNYILTLAGEDKGYFSPELMSHYGKKERNPAYDVYKSDVYSLGMTLLECASLKDPNHNYYDWLSHVVLGKNIQRGLTELETRYSANFIQLLRIMLEESEFQRPNFLGLIPYIGQTPTYVQPVTVQPVAVQPTFVQVPVYQSAVYTAPQQSSGYSYVLPQSQVPLYTGASTVSGIKYIPQMSPEKGKEFIKAPYDDISDLEKLGERK